MESIFDPTYLLGLIAAFFDSLQVKTLLGLIILDFILGIAAALRSGVFDWKKLGDFYKTNVLPYLLGYLGFWLVIGFIIPPESLAELGNPFDGVSGWDLVLVLSWCVLVATLLGSFAANFKKLYPTPQPPQ